MNQTILTPNLIKAIKTLQNTDLMVKLIKKFYGTRK